MFRVSGIPRLVREEGMRPVLSQQFFINLKFRVMAMIQRREYQGTKRSSDTSLEKLEEEIKNEEPQVPMTLDSIGLSWVDTCEPLHGLVFDDVVSLVTPATSPDVFDETVTSIKFDSSQTATSEEIQLCGSKVLLWKPSEAVDDTTLTLLNTELTYAGMKEELANMSKCDVGVVLSGDEVEEDQVKWTRRSSDSGTLGHCF